VIEFQPIPAFRTISTNEGVYVDVAHDDSIVRLTIVDAEQTYTFSEIAKLDAALGNVRWRPPKSLEALMHTIGGPAKATAQSLPPADRLDREAYRFSKGSRFILAMAEEAAIWNGGAETEPVHVVLGLLARREFVLSRALEHLGVDPIVFRRGVEDAAPTGPSQRWPSYASETRALLDRAMRIADRRRDRTVRPSHIAEAAVRAPSTADLFDSIQADAVIATMTQIGDSRSDRGTSRFSIFRTQSIARTVFDRDLSYGAWLQSIAIDRPLFGDGSRLLAAIVYERGVVVEIGLAARNRDLVRHWPPPVDDLVVRLEDDRGNRYSVGSGGRTSDNSWELATFGFNPGVDPDARSLRIHLKFADHGGRPVVVEVPLGE
jgi:hypothetical protein